MAVSPDNQHAAIAHAKPRRRWLQFHLRSLLLLLTAAVALLVAWRVYTEPYRLQQPTAEIVKRLGGRIVTVEAPAWIPRFGHVLRKIALVDVADRDDPEEYLADLAALPAFETLVVGGPQFGDQQLRRLVGLRSLRGLVLDSTEVTDAGLAEIQQALPELEVYRSPRRAVRAIEAAIVNVWGSSISLIGTKPSIQPLPQLAAVVGPEYFEDLTTCQLYSDAQILHLKHLPNLPKLRLSGGEVTDAGMVQVGKLASLTALSLEFDTQITDAGLAHLKGLTNLTDLYIMDGHVAIGPTFDAKITDAGLAHLGSLPNLRSLKFHGAGITDAGLAHLTNLESLELESSYITDDGLAHLSGLTNLRSLNLPSTDIRGSGLVHLAGLPRLAELNLGWTNISDATLKHLKEFKNLKVLRLSNVNVSEQAVSDLRTALPGCEVEFSPNADGPVMRVLISIARAAMRTAQSPQRPRGVLTGQTGTDRESDR